MSFDRNQLPDPVSYYESEGLTFTSRGKWRTTACSFHGGSDSMRINTETGGFMCMACDEKGGDVLAYHQAAHGLEFIDAAKALGAWIDDGRPAVQHKPTAMSPRDALQFLEREAMLVAVAAGNVAYGVVLSDDDRKRVLQSAGRITRVVEMFK